jgi:hypothetical protein
MDGFRRVIENLKQQQRIRTATMLARECNVYLRMGFFPSELCVHEAPEDGELMVVPLKALAKWPTGRPPAKGPSEP